MASVKKISFLCLFFFVEIFVSAALNVGDGCGTDNEQKCVLIENCPEAITALKQHQTHTLERCGFEGMKEVVCCNPNAPIPIVRKSEAACREYAIDWEELLYIPVGITPSMGFPHMAALGYENDSDSTIVWGDCSGSLISKNFVLTAAHCLIRIDSKEPVMVRLGKVDLYDENGVEPQDIRVVKNIPHPDFKYFEKRNDIALVQLEKDVEINKFVKPICLFTGENIPVNTGLITSGWSRTKTEDGSRLLMDTFVKTVDLNECNKTYLEPPSSKALYNTQLCAVFSDDSCQTSGGPLLKENREKDDKMTSYILIGVASFGRGCTGRIPDVFTKVSSYLNWIEEIVW